ncbi:MAG TPA: zinc-ribbon domain-containing protein [Actinomycetota bacterium]|nr:zinc-ribbon domain-containing protein [Actinomycetota bacterium]
MVICPVCGEENPERARFCLACGAPLEGREESSGEERRLVTVVFCELVGLGETGTDPEELKRSLDPYHALVRQQVTNYGGTVDKFMGATALSVFGAPVAHEDDPERALRVTLNVRDAVHQLAESTRTCASRSASASTPVRRSSVGRASARRSARR